MFNRFRKILTVILILVSITGLSISIYMIVSQLQEYGEGKESYKKLENFIEMPDPDITEIISDESVDKITQELQISLPEIDFAALKKLNPDIVGWIYIEETNINYPVVQGSDNQYYLKHLFNGEYNSSGCIFLDSQVKGDFSEQHSILYGHHMKNQTMFSGLDHYKKQDFFDMHPYGLLMTPEENYKVDFFSGYVANVKEDAWKIGFGSDSEFELWLKKIRTRSVFESKIPVAVTDRILTLSTCSYEFENARFVLHAILSPLGRQ